MRKSDLSFGITWLVFFYPLLLPHTTSWGCRIIVLCEHPRVPLANGYLLIDLNKTNAIQNLIKFGCNRRKKCCSTSSSQYCIRFNYIYWSYEGGLNSLNSSYRPETTHKYIISIKKLWYWIWPKSIEAFKFFRILNFLIIFSKLYNSGRFRFIQSKFCA